MACETGSRNLKLDHNDKSGARVDMCSIKVKVAENGTCTIYRNGTPICSGLTRDQAEELACVMRCMEV